MIADHSLTVRRWTLSFEPFTVGFQKIAVWVRFPELTIQFYNKQFLRRVGNRLRKILRIDETTLLASRGRFARVSIEVDLDQPLISKFMFRRRLRRMEYEGLHSVCFQCGRYGHRKEHCPESTQQPDPNNPQENMKAQPDNQIRDTNMDFPEEENIELTRPKLFNKYGEWMLA